MINLLILLAINPLQKIDTKDAPSVFDIKNPEHLKSIKYSQAISLDLENTKKIIFVSGQIAIDPKTGKEIEDNINIATNQTLNNIEAILKAAGSGWEYVARVDVFLKDWKDFNGMNEEYGKRFQNGIFPARQTIKVDMDNRVEISCIAIVPK